MTTFPGRYYFGLSLSESALDILEDARSAVIANLVAKFPDLAEKINLVPRGNLHITLAAPQTIESKEAYDTWCTELISIVADMNNSMSEGEDPWTFSCLDNFKVQTTDSKEGAGARQTSERSSTAIHRRKNT